jgi:uncharacterized protein (TIGR03435 family)
MRLTSWIACACGMPFGQSTEPAGKFELADVHPSPHATNPDASDMSGGLMPGRYQLRRATMLDLIRTAYGVDAQKVIGGPNWLEVDRFDIRAKVPAGITPATVKPMLQALLADRFGLVVHNDTKPVPAWALTASKHPQLKQSDGSGDPGCRVAAQSGPGRGATEAAPQTVPLLDIACHNITMAAFAAHMNDMDGAWNFINDNLVTDQTGLEGAWDFNLKYSHRARVTVAGAEIVTLFDALDRIGLKLDPAMVPTPAIVVDSVNRTPTPNSPETTIAFPPPPTEFEVAEVKPTDPDYHGMDIQVQAGGRVNVRGVTLKFLVKEVWGITDDMLVGAPKFMDSDRWDIVAKAPDVMAAEGDADVDALFQMVKTLLADRFKLAVHNEERPVPAYTMTATPKLKLKKADPASRTSCKEGPPTLVKLDPRSTNPVLGRLLSCTNSTMAYLADQLQFLANGYVHSAVLDFTGLEGGWDFTLSFSTMGQFQGGVLPAPGAGVAADPNGAISLPDAMEKQLGLKLELQKRPVQVLVIDHIEQKPTDN